MVGERAARHGLFFCGCGGSGGSGYDDNPKVVESRGNVTRWHEVLDCVSFHSYMASKCWIRTKMWLVNADDKDGHKFSLCCASPEDVPDEMSRLKSALKHATLAQDQCPLTAQVHKMIDIISPMASALNAHDQKVTVVICTQGLPLDEHGMSPRSVQQDFLSKLKTLSKLPVKIIRRLCTDNDSAKDFFNTLDRQMELMDVLDDYWGEVRLNTPSAPPCTQWAWSSFLKLMPECEHLSYIPDFYSHNQFLLHLDPLAAP